MAVSRGPRSILALRLRDSLNLWLSSSAPTSLPCRFCPNCSFSTSSVPPQLEHVGFIGVGNMGFHMANNLIKAGHSVTVHDRDIDALEKFARKGIPTSKTPFEITQSSDVIITMLPSSSHVMDVYTGPNGILHAGNVLRPWLFIDSSTVDPLCSRSLSVTVSGCAPENKKGYPKHCVMLDAPVSGGVVGAEAGTLTFMVGGPEEAYEATKPLLLAMGKNSFYCGGSGNGAAAKICNNLAMAISMVGISEAYALGQSLGIGAKTLARIFNSSSARCWSSDTYNPVPGVMEAVPSSRDYEGGFSCKLMAKDLGLAKAAAREFSLRSPLTSLIHEIYWEMCEKGHATQDFSCVFRHHYAGQDEKK